MSAQTLKIVIALVNIKILLSGNISQAQTQILEHNQTLAKSNPVGRVLSGDRNKQKGTLLFPGDRVHPNLLKVKVLCYLNQKILLLEKGLIDDTADKCVPKTLVRKCVSNRRSNCAKTRTINSYAQIPIILKPYSRIIFNPRPAVSWQKIPKATSYTVTFEGRGVRWTKKTQNTTLLYPAEENPIQPGNTYKLSVIANKGDSPFQVSSTVLVMLQDVQIKQIADTIDQIRNLNLPPNEEARDLDSIFMSQNLLTESINILNKRIDSGTNNPTLYRLLGDRYLQAGFPEKAKPLYIKATHFSQQFNNLSEMKKAQSGLQDAIVSLQK